MRQLIRTSIRLLWAIFLVAFGTLLLLLPTNPNWLNWAVELIQDSSSWIYLLGLFLLILGSTLIVRLFTSRKSRSLSFKSNHYATEIEEKIILEHFNRALQKLCLSPPLKSRVELRRGVIHLFATLPSSNNRASFIQSIEIEVSKNLFELLGYSQELNIELAFAK